MLGYHATRYYFGCVDLIYGYKACATNFDHHMKIKAPDGKNIFSYDVFGIIWNDRYIKGYSSNRTDIKGIFHHGAFIYEFSTKNIYFLGENKQRFLEMNAISDLDQYDPITDFMDYADLFQKSRR